MEDELTLRFNALKSRIGALEEEEHIPEAVVVDAPPPPLPPSHKPVVCF
jgi:hypothetical protein